MSPRISLQFTVFFLIVVILYSIGLATRSIWFDEAITVQSLASLRYEPQGTGFTSVETLKPFVEGVTTLPEVVRRYIETDVHPPLYFAFAHLATLILGNELYVLRAVSLFFVLASVFLFAATVRKAGEPRYLLYAAVYAFSFAALTTAQDARGYALVLFLAVWAWRILSINPLSSEQSLKPDILLGLVCGCLMLTHYFAVFVVVPILAWRFFESAYERKLIGLVSPTVCVLVFAPWILVFLDHLGARPGQMSGFHGIIPWFKQILQILPGQVFSATHWAVPGLFEMLGRGIVLLLIAVGFLNFIFAGKSRGAGYPRMDMIAGWIILFGVGLFLVASIILERWFVTLRYFLFFAPFLAFFAARGASYIGNGLVTSTGASAFRNLPLIVLLLLQVSMANFGWEANSNRGGAYYNSVADQISENGLTRSLAIVDVAGGRGTVLSVAAAFPEDSTIFLLPNDADDWDAASSEIGDRLSDLDLVVIVFSIQRGEMLSDKATLYTPIVDALNSAGFKRTPAEPTPDGGRYYAKWERTNGTS